MHSLAHAFAAAETAQSLGVPVTLRSAAGAAGYAGVGWFAALAAAARERFPSADVTFVLDCGDEAGTVMGALRRGIRRVRFHGPPEVAVKLAAMGVELDGDEAPALDLRGAGDPATACRKFLAASDPAR
ncbi:MAG TPA: hypothetical protein VKS60_18425 [Stellaceae bacterium]|nr:hypothetical protein [Stellaceae bacterium]